MTVGEGDEEVAHTDEAPRSNPYMAVLLVRSQVNAVKIKISPLKFPNLIKNTKNAKILQKCPLSQHSSLKEARALQQKLYFLFMLFILFLKLVFILPKNLLKKNKKSIFSDNNRQN